MRFRVVARISRFAVENSEGQASPRFHRLAWYDYERAIRVTMVMPLCWIVGFSRWFWFKLTWEWIAVPREDAKAKLILETKRKERQEALIDSERAWRNGVKAARREIIDFEAELKEKGELQPLLSGILHGLTHRIKENLI